MITDDQARELAARWAYWVTKRCKSARDGECFASDCEGKSRPGWERSVCPLPGWPEDASDEPDRLSDGERETLLAWVQQRMATEVDRRYDAVFFDVDARLTHEDCEAHALDREELAHAVMVDLAPALGDTASEHGLAWTLCELAGWPS